ncbi:substrate-binding domain-containing protein [Nocardia sp. CA-151230]|uniref:substrate-binding domain-containing protein n=1 Tax=Nocardia sp. CA-151230 TaxID=3239982 RepID=UPI003D8F0FAA
MAPHGRAVPAGPHSDRLGPQQSGPHRPADHVDAGRLAAGHRALTHRRENIVFIGGFTADEVTHGDRATVAQRCEGYLSVVGSAAAGSIPTDLTPEGAYRAVRRYLADRPAPDGMVIGTYAQAAATLRAVADAGLRIPQDVALVGYDADTANAESDCAAPYFARAANDKRGAVAVRCVPVEPRRGRRQRDGPRWRVRCLLLEEGPCQPHGPSRRTEPEFRLANTPNLCTLGLTLIHLG